MSYENKGLSGLSNLGNSCYLNSCMQVISHTYEFNDFLIDGKYKNSLKKIPESIVLLEWDKLREMLWDKNGTIAPHGFVNTIRHVAKIKNRDLFSGNEQNDCQEFLLFIFDCFHSALSREVEMSISGTVQNDTDSLATAAFNMMRTMYQKDYSQILNIFFGTHISQITSVDTSELLSMSAEPFSVISLSIPENEKVLSLYSCLDLFCNRELLDGDNEWFNSKTQKKEPAYRNIVFWSLPNIMIFDLKRSRLNNRKIHNLVDIPIENADFSKYVKGYKSSSYYYDLYGVCNHSGGGGGGGHYTAYVKNANGKWYSFNDTFVNEISQDQVISSMTYCLFYRKKK